MEFSAIEEREYAVNVLFVNYHHLDNNSGIHIFNLANHLTRLGVECVVCVPGQKESTASLGSALFEVVDIQDLLADKAGRNFDLIHVWTPRQVVRRMTQKLLRIYSCPYVVHLEDNEDFLFELVSRFPFNLMKNFPANLLKLLVGPNVSEPMQYRKFLEKSSGITIIIETLREFCPENLPNEMIWAGYQEDLKWGIPADIELKHRLGLGDTEFVVAYTGNVHHANRQEVADLYLAVDLLRSRGIRVKLVRTGTDHVSFLNPKLMALKKHYCIELGHIPRAELPSVLSIADVLVQPGKPGAFNDYRFPSKLPEYLASGKPVILPETNIGLYLKNNEECVLLEDGDAFDIAQKLELLFSNELLRTKIGLGGRNFAEKHLKWGYIAGKLYSFYISLLDKKA